MLRAVKIEVVDEADPVGHLTEYVLGRLPDNADEVLAAMATMLPVDDGSRTVTMEAVWLAEVDATLLVPGVKLPPQ